MQSSVRLKSQASCIKFIFLLNENIECIMISTDEKLVLLNRIADALDRLAPPKNAEIDFMFAMWGYGKNYNYKYKSKTILELEKIFKVI